MSRSKHRHRQQPIPSGQVVLPPAPPSPAPAIQLGYDPKGPSVPVDVVSSKEGWSEFTLEDGTVIRAKAMLLDVKKMVGQYNAQGEPIYLMQLIMANQALVPDKLKKKS